MRPKESVLVSAAGCAPRGCVANDFRNVVIVSPYFPPSTVAGVHRARHLAKHLPAAGWTPTVLCVDETHHEESLDPALGALVPSSVEVIKVGALPARVTRKVGLGELSLRAYRPLKRALFRALTTRKVDIVIITGSPYYPMLFAREIRKRFKVPVVLDFQDPWVSAWGATQPVLSKAGFAHRIAKVLEPRAVREADYVTAVSDTQNAEMAARYPWLNPKKMSGIPIGGDPDDFQVLRSLRTPSDWDDLEPGFIHLAYVGTFLPRADPLVRTLFRAYARLRASDPGLAAKLRFDFVGTSNQPKEGTVSAVRPIAEEEGVAEAVREIPQRLPYLRALNVLAKSHAALLIGSDEPHYTASKIYPALMSGRPHLSLFHRASSAHAILARAGGGYSFAFENNDELSALVVPLAEALKSVATNPQSLGTTDATAYEPYLAANIARCFARVFESAALSHA